MASTPMGYRVTVDGCLHLAGIDPSSPATRPEIEAAFARLAAAGEMFRAKGSGLYLPTPKGRRRLVKIFRERQAEEARERAAALADWRRSEERRKAMAREEAARQEAARLKRRARRLAPRMPVATTIARWLADFARGAHLERCQQGSGDCSRLATHENVGGGYVLCGACGRATYVERVGSLPDDDDDDEPARKLGDLYRFKIRRRDAKDAEHPLPVATVAAMLFLQRAELADARRPAI